MNLKAAVGLFGDNENLENVYAKPRYNESVSLSLTIPLWALGRKKIGKRVKPLLKQHILYSMRNKTI